MSKGVGLYGAIIPYPPADATLFFFSGMQESLPAGGAEGDHRPKRQKYSAGPRLFMKIHIGISAEIS